MKPLFEYTRKVIAIKHYTTILYLLIYVVIMIILGILMIISRVYIRMRVTEVYPGFIGANYSVGGFI